mgnify:CR=1 FL=1
MINIKNIIEEITNQYNFDNSEFNKNSFYNEVCDNYLNTIMWIYYYYYYFHFEKDGLYKNTKYWNFKYDFAPFISDLYQYINKPDYDINKFKQINNDYIKNMI